MSAWPSQQEDSTASEAGTVWIVIPSYLVPRLGVWKPGLSWDCPTGVLMFDFPYGLVPRPGSLRVVRLITWHRAQGEVLQ